MKPIDLDIDDYSKTVDTFQSETDRAAAVLAGSFVENYLAKYLRSFMVDDDEVNNLFDGFGPFADFMQRVEAAYAFGFINKEQRRDLKYIGKIRNHFAHHPLGAAFDKQPVSEWTLLLTTASLLPAAGQQPDTKQDNRNRYLAAVGMCVGTWHNSMLNRASKAEQ